MHTPSAASRLIRRTDMVSCEVAFIDCKLPGSTPKGNYSIIGAGVTQSADQVVNLAEPHGFAIGAAAMPHGITNNLHIHYTAEVFMIFKGEWRFRWGVDGGDGEFVGRAGDIVSMPTWIFRGFTNIGPDDSWIYTVLGRDETGGVIWDPKILRAAAEQHGMYLTRDNMLVDTAAGDPRPAEQEMMTPLDDDFIAGLRHYSGDELRARVTTAADRAWSPAALLDSALPGHAAELAPVIGFGMSQDRTQRARVIEPHGFSVEWLRIAPGQQVGPFRIEPKQVLIVMEGTLEVELAGDRATVGPWDIFATPAGVWRTLRNPGDMPVTMTVTTAGDARAVPEWPAELVARAWRAGVGVDPNGYLAPARLIPAEFAPLAQAA